MKKLTYCFRDSEINLVLVQDDTNSVLASPPAALKSNIPFAHIEAGFRSSDWRLAEEYNTRIVDNIFRILFAPSLEAAQNLNASQGIYIMWEILF